MKTIIIDVPESPTPFESFFGNFTRYGIGDLPIPHDLDRDARAFIIDHIVKHEPKLNFDRGRIEGPKFIGELMRLAFAFQFFAEVRMNMPPLFNNVGTLSNHPNFIAIKEKLDTDRKTITLNEYRKYERELKKIRETYSNVYQLLAEFREKKSVVKEIEIKIQLNPGAKNKTRRTETVILPSMMVGDFITNLANSALGSLTRLESFKHIANRKDKPNALLIQMLRGSMISFLRERIYPEKDQNNFSDISNSEAFLVGLVMTVAGYLMNEKDYAENPVYKDHNDPLSHYQYLWTRIKEVKLLYKDDPLYGHEESLYTAIPLMLDRFFT